MQNTVKNKKQANLKNSNDKKKHFLKSAFTACVAGISLLETMTDAAKIVAQLAMIMLSTARSSFEELQNARKCGLKLCFAVESISRGRYQSDPNISGENAARRNQNMSIVGQCNFSFRAFLREKHEANHLIINPHQRKDAKTRQTNE